MENRRPTAGYSSSQIQSGDSDGEKMVSQNPDRIKGKELPRDGCSPLPVT